MTYASPPCVVLYDILRLYTAWWFDPGFEALTRISYTDSEHSQSFDTFEQI